MKRRVLLSLFLVLILAASVGASSWSWWAPSAPPKGGSSNSGQVLWPNVNQQPVQPRPTPPVQQPETPAQPVQPTPPPSSSVTADEQLIISQVNQERLKNGLSPLQVDSALVALAKKKSQDMAVNNYFSHVSPTYGTVYSMLDSAGVKYSRAGENIATTGSVSRAHPLFMGSSGHRANILHSGYTHIGVGVVKRGVTYYVTQIFIKK
ncbi:MAG: hypothetical protein GX101_00415 [Firmicutes bacterium]|jgi:uncharacterized YkwD family protein|nr:CAP domain-containing protein [Bacillota bacterium]NLO65138.1 hypothetical protein [Bacillota bacterium]